MAVGTRNTLAHHIMTSVVTFSQARCVSCDVARADGRAFSLRAVNRMFSFAAFFTARVTLCVIRYDLLRIHTMRRRIGDRSAGRSVPIPSQLDRARTRFSTKIGSITNHHGCHVLKDFQTFTVRVTRVEELNCLYAVIKLKCVSMSNM